MEVSGRSAAESAGLPLRFERRKERIEIAAIEVRNPAALAFELQVEKLRAAVDGS